MDKDTWSSTLRPKGAKIAWQLNNIQPFQKTQTFGLHTTKHSESTPLLTKTLDDNSEKLSSVIAQAGYASKISNYQLKSTPSAIANEGTLLGPQKERDRGKKTLVLDLDETLVHSSFKPVMNADIVMPITIENIHSNVYVLVRPGVYTFLQ